MSKSRRDLPELVFVGHPKARRKFCLVLFRIEDRKDGLPRTCTMIGNDEKITIEEGMEFMTGYVPAEMLEEQRSTTAG